MPSAKVAAKKKGDEKAKSKLGVKKTVKTKKVSKKVEKKAVKKVAKKEKTKKPSGAKPKGAPKKKVCTTLTTWFTMQWIYHSYQLLVTVDLKEHVFSSRSSSKLCVLAKYCCFPFDILTRFTFECPLNETKFCISSPIFFLPLKPPSPQVAKGGKKK